MVNGQKVVKVFCHEEQSKAELRHRNRVWAENAARASGMANSMMPMMNAVGYLQYVIIAVIGATPYPTRWMNRLSEGPKTGRVLAVAAPVALMALLAVVTAYLVDGSFNPFLYFRF